MKTFNFPCGCSFPVLGPPTHPGGVPPIDFDIEAVPLNCPATWGLLGRGDTQGCFQLEKKLGQEWSRRLKPESLSQLADLTALLRPGSLGSKDERGVSMTENYCRRRHGEEPVEQLNPALEPVLGVSFGIILMQEQFMRVARELAGFDLATTDKLRRGIGKKSYEILAELKTLFLDGCARVGTLTHEQAALVWSWIEAAGRYSFCRAHAVSYGLISYYTAWAKAHHPVAFFAAWLACAHMKADSHEEIALLVEDARRFEVEILPPDARAPRPHFSTDGLRIRFGLADVKNVGESEAGLVGTLLEAASSYLRKPADSLSWFEFFLLVLTRLNKRAATSLVRSGACDFSQVSRARMLAELDAWGALTRSEQGWVRTVFEVGAEGLGKEDYLQNISRNQAALESAGEEEREDVLATLERDREHLTLIERGLPHFTTLKEALLALSQPAYRKPKSKKEPEPTGPFGGCSRPDREGIVRDLVASLTNPPSPLVDTSRRIVLDEEELLGIAVTRHRLDSVDLCEANTSVSEFLAGKSGRLLLGVEVASVRPTTTKKGKNPGQRMCLATLKDRTGSLEAVCFPDDFARCGSLFQEGAILLVHGERDKKQERNLIVKMAWQPS